MTITSINGRYFDPTYGWRDVEPAPAPKEAEPSLPTRAIDDSMAYVVDEKMQKIIDRFKATSEALRELEKAQQQQQQQQTEYKNSDYNSIPSQQKNSISSNGTASVSLKPSYFLTKSLSNYEEHRNHIMNLKKTHGYCDEAINMLLTELDNQFTSNMCKGLFEQLRGLGYKNAGWIATMFNKEYLRIRGSTGTVAGDANKVLENLGLYDVDIYFGRSGHYGKVRNFAPNLSLEAYFKGMALFDKFYDELYDSMPDPFSMNPQALSQYGKLEWERAERPPIVETPVD